MGALTEENDPFLPDNARKRREEIEAVHREAFPAMFQANESPVLKRLARQMNRDADKRAAKQELDAINKAFDGLWVHLVGSDRDGIIHDGSDSKGG